MAKRTRTTRSVRRMILEELEPRQLLSADLVPLPSDPAPLSSSLLSEFAVASLVTDQPASAASLLAERYEVVFVDARVPDQASLVADLTRSSNGSRRFEIIVLEADRDGIEQVTEALADRVQVDAVHFISHGTDGAIQLGSSWLNAKSLAANIDAVASWGHALKQDGDLLFYGCDLAGSARGRALIDWISDVTQTDVAASADATGSAILGGNWTLEYQDGSIEAQIAVSANEQKQWIATLAAPVVDVGGVVLNFDGGANPGNSIATGGRLLSGTDRAVGAIYKYTNVATINGTQVDAYIRIDAITNAVLGTIDNNAPGSYNYPPVPGSAVWAPEVNTTAANGTVDFSIYFKDAGGNALTLINFVNNSIDIDTVSGSVTEFVEYGGFDSFTVSNPTDLTISAGAATGFVSPAPARTTA